MESTLDHKAGATLVESIGLNIVHANGNLASSLRANAPNA